METRQAGGRAGGSTQLTCALTPHALVSTCMADILLAVALGLDLNRVDS